MKMPRDANHVIPQYSFWQIKKQSFFESLWGKHAFLLPINNFCGFLVLFFLPLFYKRRFQSWAQSMTTTCVLSCTPLRMQDGVSPFLLWAGLWKTLCKDVKKYSAHLFQSLLSRTCLPLSSLTYTPSYETEKFAFVLFEGAKVTLCPNHH